MSLLIPPMVQALIFGYAATYDLNHVPYAALDQDHSAASRQLLAGLDGSGVFERVADLQRASDIKSLIDARRALLVVQIDQQFERRLLSRPERRRADHRRRPQLQHGRHGGGLCQRASSSNSTRAGVATTALAPAAGAGSSLAPGTTRISKRAGS